MRAILCRGWGGPRDLTCEEVPLPALEPGAVRIDVAAAGVNFADTLIIRGRYQRRPEFPFSPGLEVAGIVAEVAPGVARTRPGQRVMAAVDWGGYAEQLVVPAAHVWPIPDGMAFVEAAGFPVAYGTSHLALSERARLSAGETLLVYGAAGGVGLAAVEVGKRLGARVVAVAGGAEKLATAGEHGADVLIDHALGGVRERVLDATGGRGVDVVFDPVGGQSFDTALRCIAWGARIVIIGFASGLIPQIPANILLVKHAAALGFYWGSYRKHRPDLLDASMAEALSWAAEGMLRPEVSLTFPLAEAPSALESLLDRKALGKVVLTMDEKD